MDPRPIQRAVHWGDLRRVTPISDVWGLDRGTPVDRYYIEGFLERQRPDITGHVLEIKDRGYTDRYGQGVTRADVLDVNPANPRATIVADLTTPCRSPRTRSTVSCSPRRSTRSTISVPRSRSPPHHEAGGGACTLPAVSRVDAHDEGDGFPEGDFGGLPGRPSAGCSL
jgi:hypothetical protein